MSKISNTTAYPTTAPASGDLLIGTDINDSNATKTFTIGSVVALTPDNTLAEVLTAGNTATNNIILTGDITCTNIIPTNIKDAAGNTGTVGQHLVKNAANALEWGAGSADTLANVLAAGNTAANYIALSGATGYLTATYVAPVDIKDNAGKLGTASQALVKSAANALAWETVGANTLQEVLTAGNTAIENINLTGQINLTGAIVASGDISGAGVTGTITVTTPTLVATDIQDNATLNGTAGQYLRKSAANALTWETVADPTLSSVLTSGNTATNNITLTGDISCTNITISTQSQAQRYIASDYVEGSYLKGTSGVPLKVPGIDAYANDAAAGALATGDVYMTDGTAVAPLNVAGILMVKQ